MGQSFMDGYSLLHLATGIVVYYWNIPLYLWIIIHTLFEILENTDIGMNFINKYMIFWPGGKSQADSLVNSIGDTFFAILGWVIASFVMK